MNKNKIRHFISIEDFTSFPQTCIHLEYLWLVEGKLFIVTCARVPSLLLFTKKYRCVNREHTLYYYIQRVIRNYLDRGCFCSK